MTHEKRKELWMLSGPDEEVRLFTRRPTEVDFNSFANDYNLPATDVEAYVCYFAGKLVTRVEWLTRYE